MKYSLGHNKKNVALMKLHLHLRVSSNIYSEHMSSQTTNSYITWKGVLKRGGHRQGSLLLFYEFPPKLIYAISRHYLYN